MSNISKKIISVDKCLTRMCRVCCKKMLLKNYEFDSLFRWWTFYCDYCGITSSVSESIDEDNREHQEKDLHWKLDPLTDEEKELLAKEKIRENIFLKQNFDPSIQEELK